MTPRSNLSKLHILIVDDEPDNRDLVMDIVTLFGARASAAESGRDAMDQLEQAAPNLILLDLHMPGMDGWEVHRRLRDRAAMRAVPIIALTALAMPEDERRVKEAGFDGYMTKPFVIYDLVELLEEWQRRITGSSSNGRRTSQSVEEVVHE